MSSGCASIIASDTPTPPETVSRSPLKPFRAEGSTVLVTGSNQGIGLGFVKALLARGAKRVYATARREDSLPALVALDPQRIEPLLLDVNDAAQRLRAAAQATDVTWLINNAGVPGSRTRSANRILAASSLDDAQWVMQSNCWSPAELCRLRIVLSNHLPWRCLPQRAA